MEHVHLVPSDDDDLYSGYNDAYPPFDVEDIQNDPSLREVLKTSYSQRTNLSRQRKSPSYGHLTSSVGFRGTSSLKSSTASNHGFRPMTAVKGAGYTSYGRNQQGVFDPLNQAAKAVPRIQLKQEDTPEERLKRLERTVEELIEESVLLAHKREFKLALDKGKQATQKERLLVKQREQMGMAEHNFVDLMFMVLFNLANQQMSNEMYNEALSTFNVIVKNKVFVNAGRLKVNIGNIYFKQGNYPKAIKFYKMALDLVSNSHKHMKIKIMQNIGAVFVKMGKYNEAVASYEYIMGEKPSFRTAFHLILCYYAIGDKERMKKTFVKMLDIAQDFWDEDKYSFAADDVQGNLYLEAIKNDELCKWERQMRQEIEHYVMTVVKLISPVIDSSFGAGFNWCLDVVKNSAHYSELSNDLEIHKAITFLHQQEIGKAVTTLKSFEKKDTKVASVAATNLAFLHYLQSDFTKAEQYAEQAIKTDHYNAAALVNKGCAIHAKGDLEKSLDYFSEALSNDTSCIEALYNLGLTQKKLNHLEDGLDCFFKMNSILKNCPEVLYQIASILELMGEMDQAVEWYLQLLSLAPSEAHLLQKMGEIYDTQGDKQQAYQYHFDSHRYFPSNLEVVEWLGSYFIESQMIDKAAVLFEQASVMQPNEVKWQLMLASCYRRSRNAQLALQTYKNINRAFPDNVECLRFLVRLATDMGLKEAPTYATELKRAEKLRENQESRSVNSGNSRPNSFRIATTATGRQGSGSSDSGSPLSRTASGSKSFLRGKGIPSTPLARAVNDGAYSDPIGPLPERPKTGIKNSLNHDEDLFSDDDGNLLP